MDPFCFWVRRTIRFGHRARGVPFFPTTARSVRHPFMGVSLAMGGTAEGTGRGQQAAWTRILEFLRELNK